MNSYRTINTIDKLRDLSETWKSKEFAFDTEFTSLSYIEQKIIGLSMHNPKEGSSVFIQFNFEDTYTTKEKDPKGGRKKVDVTHTYRKTDAIEFSEAKPYLEVLFEDAECICANAKVERKIFHKYGITNWRIKDDVNLMSWMLNVDTPSGLKDNAKAELNLSMPSYAETVKQKVGNIDWNEVNWDAYAEYGALDAFATWELREVFKPKIEKFSALEQCYRKLELPLTYHVADSEIAGIRIDIGYLKKLSVEAGKAIDLAEQKIYDDIGVEFNINSSKQLAEILFDRLAYPVIKKSDKTGARSVDEGALKELAFKGYDIADDILEYRKLRKLKTTYLDSIPLKVDSDGRLRGSFNQQGAATGRFSSNNPNLQNMPNNEEFPVKRAFIPKDGYKFLVYDWSTIEVRIMAHESGDENMIRIFTEKRDIHQETTDSVNNLVGLTLKRGQGKTINFGVLYLMGAESLAYMLNKQLRTEVKSGKISREDYDRNFVTEKTAQKIIDGYFNTYYGFAHFVKTETDAVKSSGWSWTLGGRRRPVPELRRAGQYGAGRRKAVNTPIQGGAADLIKLAIIKLAEMYVHEALDAETLLYVHDELVIEVREDQAEIASGLVKHVMENIFPNCKVPIAAEGGIYDDWAGLKQGAANKIKRKRGAIKPLQLLKFGLLWKN